MPEHVLDTVALRVMAFAHPQGIDILLEAIANNVDSQDTRYTPDME